MSPTYQYHGAFQAEIAGQLRAQLEGRVVTESAVATTDGKKIDDVAWFSDERWEQVKNDLDASIAPEIAVEVHSPGNTAEELNRERALYFEAGAEEVWFCDEDGRLSFYGEEGDMATSRLVPTPL
jgi:Uma2 family endonuclease